MKPGRRERRQTVILINTFQNSKCPFRQIRSVDAHLRYDFHSQAMVQRWRVSTTFYYLVTLTIQDCAFYSTKVEACCSLFQRADSTSKVPLRSDWMLLAPDLSQVAKGCYQ